MDVGLDRDQCSNARAIPGLLSAELVCWFAEGEIANAQYRRAAVPCLTVLFILFERLFILRRQTECNLTSHWLPNSILKGYTKNILQLLLSTHRNTGWSHEFRDESGLAFTVIGLTREILNG